MDFGFRISNFEFRICHPESASSSRSLESAWRCCGGPRSEGRKWQVVSHSPGTRNPTAVATRSASSTVDTPQSAAMTYSLPPLGKSRRARPVVAFRGRVGGGWGREKEVRGRPPARVQPAGAPKARSGADPWDRRTLAFGGAMGRDRGRGRRPRTAGVRARARARIRKTRPCWARLLAGIERRAKTRPGCNRAGFWRRHSRAPRSADADRWNVRSCPTGRSPGPGAPRRRPRR